MAKGPRTRVSTKIFIVEPTPIQDVEISESAHEEVKADEKDQNIKELQD